MIEVRDVSKRFGSRTVLSGIQMELRDGECFGLIGYNGVGKTTLMKLIAGVFRPDSGEILLDGKPVYEHPGSKRRLFFMTEESTVRPHASLREMERFYRGYYPDWDRGLYGRLVGLFGLNPREKLLSYSKGMQRQAGLILAFSSRTPWLLLDEAFDGLDIYMRELVKRMLRYYVEKLGGSVLISSHNLEEVQGVSDRVGLLDGGNCCEEISGDAGSLMDFFARGKEEGDIDAIDWDKIFGKS